MIILDSNIIANGATTQYGCLDINSMTKFSNKHLCATSTGLYEFSGSDDDKKEIESYFITSQMDFTLSNEKRLRFVYIKYEASSKITLTISTERNYEESYYLPPTTDIQSVYRVTVNRSLIGSYWQFKFLGASFSIDEIAILPIIRRHKLMQ